MAHGLGPQCNRILSRVHSLHHFALLSAGFRPIGRGTRDHGFGQRHTLQEIRPQERHFFVFGLVLREPKAAADDGHLNPVRMNGQHFHSDGTAH